MSISSALQATCDTNTAVLTNAVELGANVVMDIAGNAIANTLNGVLVTPDFLKEALTARLQSILTPQVGAR